jgi:hypothetical protein
MPALIVRRQFMLFAPSQRSNFPPECEHPSELACVWDRAGTVHLGPNGALGADEHQWILYRSGNAVSFVHSTKLILARCIREKGIELSPEGRAALDVLADDFSTWRT